MTIKPHRPVRHLVGLVVLASLAGACGYIYQEQDKVVLTDDLARLEREGERLQQANRGLVEDNDSLRKRVMVLERAQQVERTAYREVDGRLRELQDAVLALKEEVAFYRAIVSSGESKGLAVQAFVVDRDGRERGYRFQVVLTRSTKNDKVVKGTVALSVTGEHGGQSRKLSLDELSGPEASPLAFQFKYFQRLEGRLTLPDGFVPQRVYVQVSAPGEHPARLERAFDWPPSLG